MRFQTFGFCFTTLRPGQYANVLVEVVASKPSLEFYKKEEIEAIGARVWTDEDEWTVSRNHDEFRCKRFNHAYGFRGNSTLATQFYI